MQLEGFKGNLGQFFKVRGQLPGFWIRVCTDPTSLALIPKPEASETVGTDCPASVRRCRRRLRADR